MSRDAVPSWHVQTTIYAEGSGERVATVFLAEENARLIAAAPDLLIERDALLESRERLISGLQDCQKQRNELLAALEDIASGLTNGQIERRETFQTIARAAIDKARPK